MWIIHKSLWLWLWMLESYRHLADICTLDSFVFTSEALMLYPAARRQSHFSAVCDVMPYNSVYEYRCSGGISYLN